MTTVSDMPTGRERRTLTAGVAHNALSVSQGSATGVGARTSPSAGKGAGAGLGVGSRGAKLKVRRSKTTWWPTVAECHRRSGDRRPPRPRPPRSSSSRCSSASSSPPPSRPLSWLLLTSLRAVWLSLCVAQVEGHSGHRYGDVDYFPPTKFPVVVRTAPLQHSDTSLSPARRDGTRTRSTGPPPRPHQDTRPQNSPTAKPTHRPLPRKTGTNLLASTHALGDAVGRTKRQCGDGHRFGGAWLGGGCLCPSRRALGYETTGRGREQDNERNAGCSE